MDGVPIFNLVRETLPAVSVARLSRRRQQHDQLHAHGDGTGTARSTTALAEMQARGIAEADASLDVDGWDAAAKTAALANVLLRREHHAARTSTGRASRRTPDGRASRRVRRGGG